MLPLDGSRGGHIQADQSRRRVAKNRQPRNQYGSDKSAQEFHGNQYR